MSEISSENSDKDYAHHVAMSRAYLEHETADMARAQVHATLALAAAIRGLDVTQMIAGEMSTYGRQ